MEGARRILPLTHCHAAAVRTAGYPVRPLQDADGRMAVLSVNLNKVAVLRNSRGGDLPDPIAAARVCLAEGCRGLTVHPRPDARHIRREDVLALSDLVAAHEGVELNIEGNPFAPARPGYPGLLELVRESRPAQCTLVPDGDGQLTSDHGFDLRRDAGRLRPLVAELRALGCRVSLFMDPGTTSLEPAADMGAHRVEIYTGPYAEAFAAGSGGGAALQACVATAEAARAAGLAVNAGHDLDQRNLGPLLAAIPWIAEVSIGHALIGEALYDGLATTVRRYLAITGG
ncbi:pyridoxine 5'-phosphate synthase [Pseudofulvimonas gallinarii]|jgi:pyridoxine 5-phosphate synthase|uniref:Pyridoxine 5'-phosphate synthase n=2 Tax=Pseudofulvimonas gallinarii TaxID=634155 RepID=A0A4R3L1R2_9GAMM|nr:pyridoxine 5'-phosphate synthase [Pseudofulvimonas gallinarii]